MTVKIQISCLVFSGFINGTQAFHFNIPVGSMMFASGTMFLIGAIVDTILLVKVFLHSQLGSQVISSVRLSLGSDLFFTFSLVTF